MYENKRALNKSGDFLAYNTISRCHEHILYTFALVALQPGVVDFCWKIGGSKGECGLFGLFLKCHIYDCRSFAIFENRNKLGKLVFEILARLDEKCQAECGEGRESVNHSREIST